MSTSKNVVLVAVDFEPASRHVVDFARDLATRVGAELVLLHVCEVPLYPYPGFDPVLNPGLNRQITEAARAALAKLASLVGEPRTLLRRGEPAAEILAAIHEETPRMIVVGTHGRGPLSRALLGSVAVAVVRGSPVPVVTVRAPDPG